MYVPAKNRENRAAPAREIVRRYPFALLLSSAGATLHSTHLPFVLDEAEGEHGTLYFHLARANPHARALPTVRSRVVFQGPHAYVSPGWYLETRSVPTWNYAVVHMDGVAVRIDDDVEKKTRLAELVAAHETAGGWSFAENLATVDNELRGIVAFRMPVDEVTAKFKLSQNLPEGDRHAVIARLENARDQHAREVADLMRERESFR